MAEVLDQLWKDCTDPSGKKRIDVVVATHRHKDHVSGFADPRWSEVEVGEVWMPWTEHPTDPEAKRIRLRQAKLAAAVDQAVRLRLTATPADASLLTAQDLAVNALSNAKAMTTLHEGFAGAPERRFLPDKTQTDPRIDSDLLPGVLVYVLGPSRKQDVIRDMEPPAGESYLRLAGSSGAAAGVPRPFSADWVDTQETMGGSLSPQDRAELAGIGNDADLAVAVSLDKAVNGTSLMIVLRVGQTHLLFPGDAQWGTWQAALGDPVCEELLQKTRFLKVGHHGSHNASPKDFVEKVMPAQNVVAMVSTKLGNRWPEIPREPLLEALRGRGATLVRSDEVAEADQAVFKPFGTPNLYVDVAIPAENG
jgi:beta-lactamase superfamily II metal-dependent hydrolase